MAQLNTRHKLSWIISQYIFILHRRVENSIDMPYDRLIYSINNNFYHIIYCICSTLENSLWIFICIYSVVIASEHKCVAWGINTSIVFLFFIIAYTYEYIKIAWFNYFYIKLVLFSIWDHLIYVNGSVRAIVTSVSDQIFVNFKLIEELWLIFQLYNLILFFHFDNFKAMDCQRLLTLLQHL